MRDRNPIDGILNVNKPRGVTSHDVVSLVRRLSHQRRIGHAGTLDPMAQGVLVVALGKATRLIEYMMEGHKVYCAEIVLGATTTTYDAEGELTSRVESVDVTREQLDVALSALTGNIQQLPPMYSALKVGGQRLYDLARKGIEIERQPRPVTVHQIRVIDWQSPVLKVELDVSKGTYIRSIAHDLGQMLGTGAYLNCLVRVASGRFSITDALTPSELELAFQFDYWQELLYAPDEGLLPYGAVIVDEAQSAGLHQGKSWPVSSNLRPDAKGPARAYDSDGNFLAVLDLEQQTGRWQPAKVLF
jgi:tRNA pseudouridine55 synthase